MALTTTTPFDGTKNQLEREALLIAKVAELQTAVTALTALANDIKATYNTHVHVADAAPAGAHVVDAADVTL